MAKDPVCGMEVNETMAAAKLEYQGKMYYFCSPGCKRSFEQDPAKYVGKPKEAQKGESHGHH